LIEGTYPNFRQVIPGPAQYRITLERESFLGSLQRVGSILATDKASSVKMHLADDNLDVTAASAEVGEAQESLPIKYQGPKMTVAFNPDYLMAPLRNLDVDEVYLDLIDELNPGVLRISQPFLYVIMPMRTATG
jgi:DNA polymerase-3 subunit beta